MDLFGPHNNFITEHGFSPPSSLTIPKNMEEEIGEHLKIKTFPDGSAVLEDTSKHNNATRNISSTNHEENVALLLNDNELQEIGNTLKQAIEDDIASQTPYFTAVATAMKNLGLDLNDTKNDDPFEGASNIYSSAMFESIINIVTTAKSILFPQDGMVDIKILGTADDNLQDIAVRQKDFFNYFFDVIAKEFKKEAIRTIFWAALAGSAYKKVFICPILGRPTSVFIPIQDFIVNRDQSSHLAAIRKTHILHLNELELQIRIKDNIYRDITVNQQDNSFLSSEMNEQLEKIGGYEARQFNRINKNFDIFECHTEFYIKGDPKGNKYNIPLPYIISLDASSGKILRIVRNWEKDDILKKKQEYFVNYNLLPSLNGEGYGMANYAGRLAEAATSLTRQLINTGTFANFPGGIYQAPIRFENNNLRLAPGEFAAIQTGGLPIDQVIMPLPYKEPSAILNDLKNQIEDNIKKPSAIINDRITDIMPKAPIGSTLAMLEGMQKIPNAILQGFHESFTLELELLKNRFAQWLPENQSYPFLVPGGQHKIIKSDFEANIQVIPASSPSTQNAAHRFLLSEIVINNAKSAPEIHNLEYAFKYFYKKLGLNDKDIKELLSPPNKKSEIPAQPQDPVSTIMALTQGIPVTAAVWQNHDAYLIIIDNWIKNNPNSPNIAAAMALKTQHESFKYLVDTYSQLNIAPPEDPSQLTPEQQNELAIMVAKIKLQEEAQQQQQPTEQPLDPAKVMLEDSYLKAQTAHEKNILDKEKLDLEREKMHMEFNLKEQEFHLKAQMQTLKNQLDEQKITMDALLKEREQALKESDKNSITPFLQENIEAL